MIKLSINEIADLLAISSLQKNSHFEGVSIDSRHVSPGNLFIAIKGEKFDGHQFLNQALSQGAVAAIVETPMDVPLPQLVVPDSVLALGKIAAHWRSRFSIPVTVLTGSNGKTTVKNMLASILAAACDNDSTRVLATKGNLNNHIGLPLNLLRLNEHHRYAVLEMGMNHLGEIAYLTHLAKPNIAIINNAGAAHLEGLGDVAGVAKAKGEIFLGLHPNGIAILNQDDAFFDYWLGLIGTRTYLTFGLTSSSTVNAQRIDSNKMILKICQKTIPVTLSLLGRHNQLNALAAAAAAEALHINPAAIKTGLEQVKPAPGRMQPYQLPHQVLVIDDTYNANPFSLQASIDTLASYSAKKLLVLGDMKELGPNAVILHRAAGKQMLAAGIDVLFTYGELSRAASEAFGEDARHFTDLNKLIAAIKIVLTQDIIILVKGSRSMQMEKVIEQIVPAEQLVHAH